MFTRDRLPEYFVQGEPKFHRMAPNLNLTGEGRSFFDENPRDDPSYWTRSWYVVEDHEEFYGDQPEKTKNYFGLLDPAPIGYATGMWFNLKDVRDLRYLWYWRAVVWHDLQTMVEGHWWVSARWLKKNTANTYRLIFEKENDMVIAAAYIASLECSAANMGK